MVPRFFQRRHDFRSACLQLALGFIALAEIAAAQLLNQALGCRGG
jgi:hypothetical protein